MHSFLIAVLFLAFLLLPCLAAANGDSARLEAKAKPKRIIRQRRAEKPAQPQAAPRVEQAVVQAVEQRVERRRGDRRHPAERVAEPQVAAKPTSPVSVAVMENPSLQDPDNSGVRHRRAILLKCVRVSQLKQIHLTPERGGSRAA